MDQWGWNEEDTILYLGITMACGGVLVNLFYMQQQYHVVPMPIG